MRRSLLLMPLLWTCLFAFAQAADERAQDQAAYADVERALNEGLPDVLAVTVLQRGRRVYEFHRDGAPDTQRVVASVTKSALSTLVGVALGQGRIASLDQPVLALMPEWAGLNGDERSATITLRHLLTMSAGFDTGGDVQGTAPPRQPREAWARPLVAAPGDTFAYDNSLVPMLAAILEKVTGSPIGDYARRELTGPLGMGDFDLRRGLRMRTQDMAKLGQLALQKGRWEGRQIVPEAYMLAATQVQNAGGPPVSQRYGYMWWVIPSTLERQTFMAVGFGGQYIWVYPPLDLVVAVNSTPNFESNRGGQALQLIRRHIFAAAQKRAAAP